MSERESDSRWPAPLRWTLRAVALLLVLLLGPAWMALAGDAESTRGNSWRFADRSSAGIAPDPMDAPEAIVQAYAARAWSWRGHLAVHTWFATKAAGAERYRVHHVVGFRAGGGRSVVVSEFEEPDRHWYGNRPVLLLDIRGEQAAALLPQIEAAVAAYPYSREYTLWPGPNSNTFTAWVARQVPALGLELPVTAIGKDYLDGGALVGPSPSGTGYQLSLLGALGVMVALEEGIEFNVLGLAAGIDFNQPAIKFPGIGRIGMAQQRVVPSAEE